MFETVVNAEGLESVGNLEKKERPLELLCRHHCSAGSSLKHLEIKFGHFHLVPKG